MRRELERVPRAQRKHGAVHFDVASLLHPCAYS
jgi:hypothetical protein